MHVIKRIIKKGPGNAKDSLLRLYAEKAYIRTKISIITGTITSCLTPMNLLPNLNENIAAPHYLRGIKITKLLSILNTTFYKKYREKTIPVLLVSF